MQTVVIVIHLMVIVALVAVVLLQRSEGGALGIGGGDKFMTMRGQGNVLTRATTILAAIFFVTSMAMSILARMNAPPTSVLDIAPAAQTVPTTPTTPATTPTTGDSGTPAAAGGSGTTGNGSGILDQLNRYTGGPPAAVTPKSVVPDTTGPTAPADPAQAPATSQ
jgi:preprotein translocase subunit SecG